jgi:hypothetical protein
MAQIYPNIVPENNLRLPDALTIKHGPAPLLARFILMGDRAAREMGLRLRLRTDFDNLVYLNKQQLSAGNWFRLVNTFDPDYNDLTEENSFWVSGEDQHGEIAATFAGRVYYWPDTNLEEQACGMFYGRETGHECIVTAPAAKLISGVVFSGGAAWVRPDFRGHQASRLFPRIGKAYACSRWPVDWTMGYVSRILIEKGVAAGYGQRNLSYSVFYPASPWGNLEVVIAYTSAAEVYDDLIDFMREKSFEIGTSSAGSRRSSTLDERVTNISSEEVLHGSSSRS